MPKFERSTPTGNEDAIDMLIEKIKEIEDSMNVQHEVNEQIRHMLTSDERLQHVYDDMCIRLEKLEGELLLEKRENVRLGLINESVFGAIQELTAMVKKHEDFMVEMVHSKVPRLPELPVEPSIPTLRLADTMPYLSSFDHVTDIPTFPEFPEPITTKPASPDLMDAVSSSRQNSATRRRSRKQSPAVMTDVLAEEAAENEKNANKVTEVPYPPHSLAFPPEDIAGHTRQVLEIKQHAVNAGTLTSSGSRPSAMALQQSYQAGYQAGYVGGYDAAKDVFLNPDDGRQLVLRPTPPSPGQYFCCMCVCMCVW
jgi:hypothetical protein